MSLSILPFCTIFPQVLLTLSGPETPPIEIKNNYINALLFEVMFTTSEKKEQSNVMYL
jgi:hypothetical protein